MRLGALISALLLNVIAAPAADLPGWIHEGPRATFAFEKGELATSGQGHVPNWIRSEREYENFRLTFEYNLAQWAEAAVYLRAPRSHRPAGAGVAIVLAHDFHNQTSLHVTGAVRGRFTPATFLKPGYGKWRRVEIEYKGSHLRVLIDGVAVQDRTVESRLARGHLGFPDLGYAYRLRNLRIEDLGAPTKLIELQQAAGDWHRRGDSGSWVWRDGIVTGANGHSILYAPGEFANFEFSALVRTQNRVNSGVFFRGYPDADRSRGFEVQIYSPVEAVFPTGSIYGQVRASLTEDLEGRWFLLQVRLEGTRCRVWIDGSEVAASHTVPAGKGRIGLQIHLEDSSVQFRDLRVRILE
jgi:hypothetical protein